MNNTILLKISKFFLYLVPFAVVVVYQGTIFPFIVGKYFFFRTTVELALIFFIWGWAVQQNQKSKIKNQSDRKDSNVLDFKAFKSPLVVAVAAFVFIFLLSGFLGYNPSASFWSNYERGEGGLQLLALFVFFSLLILLFRDKKSWRRLLIISLTAAVLLTTYGVFAGLKYKDAVTDPSGNIICGQLASKYPGVVAQIDSSGNIACGPFSQTFSSFLGSDFCGRFAGSLGNAAYVGTYMIFMIFYSLYLLRDEKKSKAKKWVWVILGALFFVALLFSQTRGALIGLVVALFAGLIYLFFALAPSSFHPVFTKTAVILVLVFLGVSVTAVFIKSLIFLFTFILLFTLGLGLLILLVAIYLFFKFASLKKSAIALFLLGFLFVLASLGVMFRSSIDLMPFCKVGGNRIIDISLGGETYQTRLLLWKQSVKAFEERPILGWGPENFNIAFEKYFNVRHTAWFDRAHNIFFDYLVFSGILGLLSFVGVFFVFYWQFFRIRNRGFGENREKQENKKNSPDSQNSVIFKKVLFFALPIAYLVQGLVLFDVLPIYINLFLFLAFSNFIFTEEKEDLLL